MDALTAAVDRLVVDLAGPHHLPEPGTDVTDRPLADRGVDSMGVVALIAALEKELGILFPAEAMNRQTFATVASVVAVVRGLLGPAGEE